MSHYATLGVDQTATQEEIKKAYRKLSKQHHPDVNGGEDQMFKQVVEAYEVLSNEQKRQQYDARNQSHDFFKTWGGTNDGDFSSLFEQMFGRAYGNNTPQKGMDMRVDMHISFGEAFSGTSKTFNLNGENIQMNFKPGLKNGQKFRIHGKGQAHPYNQQLPKGDVIVTINVIQDSRFILQGDDIWIETTLPWYDIVLGGSVNVMTPEGPLTLKIPKNTQPGKTLRVQDKGFPVYGENRRGALLCRINPWYPELNEEQLEYIKKIKHINNGN